MNKEQTNLTNTIVSWVDWEPTYWAIGIIITYTIINTGIIQTITAKLWNKEKPKLETAKKTVTAN